MFKNLWSKLQKFFINTNYGQWRRLSGSYNNSSRELITDFKLIELYKRYSYACALINAFACARVRCKLYVKTETGDPKTKLRTLPVSNQKYAFLTEKFNLQKYSLKNLEEVTEHPLLDYLERFNDSELVTGYLAKLWTFAYLEVTGRAYWLLEQGLFGLPINSWVLPTQYVYPWRDPGSKKILDYYRYYGEGIQHDYQLNEVVQFMLPDLNNPYLYGRGPHEASFEANMVSNKWISHESSFLDNEARPDFILSPKDAENTIGADEAENLEKRFISKFGRGRSGKVFVPDEAMVLTPINYPPKDLAGLEINKEAKHEIANTHGIPIALIEGEKVSKQVLDGALTQHALLTVSPRLQLYDSVINKRLIPLYDQSGRLMLSHENPVPEDQEAKLQENIQLKSNGCITGNEVRDNYNYPPHPDGDKLESQNVAGSGGKERQNARASGSADK